MLEAKQQYNMQEGQAVSLEGRIAQARASLKEYETRLVSLAADQVSRAREQLDVTLADRAQNMDLTEKLKEQVARLVIAAPVDGIVKGLNVNTVGSVVQPGQLLMEIVPTNDTLVVSLKIPPKYIGHIKPGQAVQVKFSTYDFARYGALPGRLTSLSATTFNGEGGERFYQGKVVLERSYVGASPENRVLPGMTVMADIVTGDKTILQYLLKPIQAAATAFTER